jgi:hypothetical protein
MNLKLPPVNRIVAFAGPYVALLSGAVASWLVVHVEVIGSLGLGQDKLAHGIAYGATALIGAGLPHLGMQKWLDGHQKFTSELFGLVRQLPEATQHEVVGVLPALNGDVLKAIESAVHPSADVAKAANAGVADAAGDGSGDVEHLNELVDVLAPPLDPLPAPEEIGNDAVHAPPDAGAGAKPPAAPASGEAGAA